MRKNGQNGQRLRTRRDLRGNRSVEDVFKRVAAAEGIALEALKKRSRMSIASESRKRGAYICCRVLGYRIEEVAAYLQISGPAVSLAIAQVEKLQSKRYVDKIINLPPG